MKVLAFDTAISTGCAFGVAGGTPKTWQVALGKTSWDARFARCLRMVESYAKQFEPDLIVVEAPAAGNFSNADLVGLSICVRAQAARMGIPVKSYYPNPVRKYFLGKALTSRDFPGKTKAAAKGAIKAAVIARCHLLGWDVVGSDAADAAALWDYACSQESRAHQLSTVGGLFA